MSLQKITMSDGLNIACRWFGSSDKPVLVLSNSLGTTHDMWAGQIEALGRERHILCYDTRGHGASDIPEGGTSLDRLALDVLELMDHFDVETFDFCGVSLGGMTGQMLAARAGDRLGKLILSMTSAYMGPPSGWQDRIGLVMKDGVAAISDAVLERWFTADFYQSSPDMLKKFRDELASVDAKGYAACCAAIRDMDLRPLAALNKNRPLIIAGKQDTATPLDHARFLHQAIMESQLVTLDGAHLSNVECPEEYNAAVLKFLAQA